MYIIIWEDGTAKRARDVGQDELSACEDGYMQIIDITTPDQPREYADGEWRLLEDWNAERSG